MSLGNWTGGEETYHETYTVVTLSVPEDPSVTETDFRIYWWVPLEEGETYTIQIDNGFDDPYTEVVEFSDGQGEELLLPRGSFELNEGVPISIP